MPSSTTKPAKPRETFCDFYSYFVINWHKASRTVIIIVVIVYSHKNKSTLDTEVAF